MSINLVAINKLVSLFHFSFSKLFMNSYYKQLNFLRAYAVMAVVFGHMPLISIEGTVFKNLYSFFQGVPIFFAISGFLITSIIHKNAQTGGRFFRIFYIRRFLRIFPLYYLVVFSLILVNVSGYREYAVYDLLYISNFRYGLEGGFGNSIAPHFWSLAVEEQFYLWWPVTLIFFQRYLGYTKLIVVLFFVSITITLIYIDSFFVAHVIRPISFLTGGGLLSMFYSDYLAQKKRMFDGVSFVLITLILVLFYQGVSLAGELIFIFSLYFAMYLVYRFSIGVNTFFLKQIFENPVLIYIGKISYGIYVYHLLMVFPVMIVLKLTGFSHLFSLTALQGLKIAATLIVASLSWELFENPINNMKSKFNYVKA